MVTLFCFCIIMEWNIHLQLFQPASGQVAQRAPQLSRRPRGLPGSACTRSSSNQMFSGSTPPLRTTSGHSAQIKEVEGGGREHDMFARTCNTENWSVSSHQHTVAAFASVMSVVRLFLPFLGHADARRLACTVSVLRDEARLPWIWSRLVALPTEQCTCCTLCMSAVWRACAAVGCPFEQLSTGAHQGVSTAMDSRAGVVVWQLGDIGSPCVAVHFCAAPGLPGQRVLTLGVSEFVQVRRLITCIAAGHTDGFMVWSVDIHLGAESQSTVHWYHGGEPLATHMNVPICADSPSLFFVLICEATRMSLYHGVQLISKVSLGVLQTYSYRLAPCFFAANMVLAANPYALAPITEPPAWMPVDHSLCPALSGAVVVQPAYPWGLLDIGIELVRLIWLFASCPSVRLCFGSTCRRAEAVALMQSPQHHAASWATHSASQLVYAARSISSSSTRPLGISSDTSVMLRRACNVSQALQLLQLHAVANHAARDCWWVCNRHQTGLPVGIAKHLVRCSAPLGMVPVIAGCTMTHAAIVVAIDALAAFYPEGLFLANDTAGVFVHYVPGRQPDQLHPEIAVQVVSHFPQVPVWMFHHPSADQRIGHFTNLERIGIEAAVSSRVSCPPVAQHSSRVNNAISTADGSVPSVPEALETSLHRVDIYSEGSTFVFNRIWQHSLSP